MPNCWSFFCGKPELVDGGQPMAAWRREIQEEIGVTLAADQIIPLGDYVDPRYGVRRHVFAAAWPDLTTTFVLGEGDAVAWFSIKEALALPDLPQVAKDDLRRFAQSSRLRGSACPD
jgi:8-oxo-dGTP pyrophosphatase MutT (NUDIX family)